MLRIYKVAFVNLLCLSLLCEKIAPTKIFQVLVSNFSSNKLFVEKTVQILKDNGCIQAGISVLKSNSRIKHGASTFV